MVDRSAASPDGAKPEALQDYVARKLAQAISAGELAPGQKLSPTKIAAQYGVSHIPVREALAALEATSQVRRVPHVGFFVAELSLKELEDVYHWRRVLEEEAHAMAIRRLDLADFALMRRLNDSAMKPANSRRGGRFVELNRQFHFVPYEKAGSETLMRFLNHLWDSAARYQATVVSSGAFKDSLHAEHDAIVGAFETRNLKRVNQLMARHRNDTLEAIHAIVESGGLAALTPASATTRKPARTKKR